MVKSSKSSKSSKKCSRGQRAYELSFYKEWENVSLMLFYYFSNYKVAYVLHDCDLDDSGNLKKSHYHLIVYFNNTRTFESVYKEYLNISKQDKSPHTRHFVMQISDLKVRIRYLIHLDNPEKHLYDKEKICSNFILDRYFTNDMTDEETLEVIFNFIDNQCKSSYRLELGDLTVYCVRYGYIKVLRKYYSQIKDYWYFHK